MKHIPFKNADITDPKYLFGRNNLLSILYDHAERLDQIQLIGARRFGKTCLLKCLVTLLKSEGEHNAYPIYLDLKSHRINGTNNVYRYLSSTIISNLYVDEWINETPISYSDIVVSPKRNWREVYRQIDEDSDTITDFFESLVKDYSALLEQTFLLLFDEYEAMAKAFDRIDGFMTIRELCNDESRPISFWLAGATPWRYFTKVNNNQTVGGSGEFNGIEITHHVRPLDYDSFLFMWEYECGFLDEQNKNVILKKVKEVYEATGCVPFYAKSIGSMLCVDHVFPDYTSLQDHFSEMEKMLSEEEYKTLRVIYNSPKTFSEPLPNSVGNLRSYGLLKKDSKNRFYIPIKFYADYIKSLIYDQQNSAKSDNNTINQLVEKIVTLIYTINENWMRRHRVFMFDPSNDDAAIHHKNLRTICTDRGKFSNFISAIYILHWEGSKVNSTGGAKLPPAFKNSYFRKAIDRLRHTFGNAHQTDKLVTSENQIDKGAALDFFTGSTTEPITPSDWMQLQDCILKQYKEELTKINDSISQTR